MNGAIQTEVTKTLALRISANFLLLLLLGESQYCYFELVRFETQSNELEYMVPTTGLAMSANYQVKTSLVYLLTSPKK